jgi:hypothetical protein
VDAYLAVASKLDQREYAERPVPDYSVSRILDAGRIAGGAKNRQPWRFRFAGRNAEELAVALAREDRQQVHVEAQCSCFDHKPGFSTAPASHLHCAELRARRVHFQGPNRFESSRMRNGEAVPKVVRRPVSAAASGGLT